MPKARCTNDIDGIAPASHTNESSRARSGWYYPLPASLFARRDASLMALLKALVFFASERPKCGELPKDNSSSARVSTSEGMTGSFPLLRVIGYAA